MSEERLDKIEYRLENVEHGLDVLKENVRELGTHMRVLHEDTVARIQGIGDGFDGLRAEMRTGFSEVMRALADHAIPGDAADRRFAAQLEDHEHRIQALERGHAG